MVARRSVLIAADRDEVWRLVADPWRMPLWWPRTSRVEAVNAHGWTTVHQSDRGRAMRVDWRLDVSRKPRLRRWSQQLEDTPFERLFARNSVELRLDEAEGGGTRVHLAIEQDVLGWARLAPFLIRRAARRQAREALAELDAVLGAGG